MFLLPATLHRKIEEAFPLTFLTISQLPRTISQLHQEKLILALQITHLVMQAYYAKESPIPLPTIVPPSSILSPMFNPQEFFLPEELFSLKKQGRDRSSSSTSALPQAFKIGESSPHRRQNRRSSRNGRVIIQQDFDNLEAELRESRTQIAKLQKKTNGKVQQIALASLHIASITNSQESRFVTKQIREVFWMQSMNTRTARKGPSDY
ncbi:hypothetical protein Tco_1387006 [Tanacetum coccineum]